MYRFRVKMAAMGRVEESVEENSALSPDLGPGSWYGTTTAEGLVMLMLLLWW